MDTNRRSAAPIHIVPFTPMLTMGLVLLFSAAHSDGAVWNDKRNC